MYKFSQFIDDIKENRKSEINIIKGKGYNCQANYKFFDYFNVLFYDTNYDFSLFCTNGEITFLSVEKAEDDSNDSIKTRSKYYSMTDIFDKIRKKDVEKILLNTFFSSSERQVSKIIYRNKLYELETPKFDAKKIKKISKNDHDLFEFFVTFFLIQNKANVYFNNKKEYIDGIYRFLKVYSECNQSYDSMKKRGWVWCDEKKKYEYNDYLEVKAILLDYNGKEMMKEENAFYKQLKNIKKDKNDNINEKVFDFFLSEYNKDKITKYNIDEFEKEDCVFDLKISTENGYSEKIIERCKSLKTRKDGNEEKCFTTNPVTIDINHKIYLYLYSKFNKKYYLTEDELCEIIKYSPS